MLRNQFSISNKLLLMYWLPLFSRHGICQCLKLKEYKSKKLSLENNDKNMDNEEYLAERYVKNQESYLVKSQGKDVETYAVSNGEDRSLIQEPKTN